MFNLTDDTGVLEHSLGTIPQRKEGYSTDDQARALWACLEWLDISQVTTESASPLPKAKNLQRLIDTHLSFLLWVQKENGHFHNNVAYDRTWEKESPSDDCFGRCLWSCARALTTLRDHPRRYLAAAHVLINGMNYIKAIRFPRGAAFALAASALLATKWEQLSQEEHFTRLPDKRQLETAVEKLTNDLLATYQKHRTRNWHWFESAITYGNGVMPWGLWYAYEYTEKKEVGQIAKESLDFLIEKMTNSKGYIRPVGNKGWCREDFRADWDQQPIDVMKLALASFKAYAVTKDRYYQEIVKQSHAWFYGANDLGICLVDREEGCCCDGLNEHGANPNSGAESTIAYLLTEAIYFNSQREVQSSGVNQ